MPQPPKWADKFLSWYCNPDLLEEIQGDVYELFDNRVAKEGAASAKRKFAWDVLRFFRWSNIKRTTTQNITLNNTAMIGNYFKTGMRNLIKDKVTSAISILGLALAVGSAITSYIFVTFFLNMDSFHTKRDNIYQVINVVNAQGQSQQWSDVPITMEASLKEISGVDELARIEYGTGNMRYNELVFNEFIYFTDPEFLKIFDFPIESGNKEVLNDKAQIFLSKRVATKYFGETDPIGKQISMKYEDGSIYNYFVGGVFQKFPNNASFAPSVLISIESYFDRNADVRNDWSYLTDGIFLTLSPNANAADIESYFPSMVKLQNDSQTEMQSKSFDLMSMEEVSKITHTLTGSVLGGGSPAGRILLSVIAVLLLILASANYVNISVSSSTKRLKEIAMRKVLGGTRNMVIKQFLIENVIICTIAMVIGVFISYFLFLPGFNSLLPIVIPFSFTSVINMGLFFGALLLFVGLASGLYPAFYISKFQAITIFRGNQKFGQKSIFSRILLTLQFVIAFFTIVTSFVFTDVSMQLANADWGYDAEDVITVPINNDQIYTALHDKLIESPKITTVSGSFGHIGPYNRISVVKHAETDLQANIYMTDEHYLDVLDLNLLEGRFYNTKGDANNAVVSQRLVRKMKWTEPLKSHFYYDSVRYEVIGVVDDFSTDDYYHEALPVAFIPKFETGFNYLTIRTTDGDKAEAMDYVKASWKEIAPDDPFDGIYQTKVMDSFYDENAANVILITAIAAITLFLACLGLYGLVTFNINRRMKEFSVRKVLGANLSTIVGLINRDYVWILSIAFIIGAPLGVINMSSMLKSIYPDAPSVTAYPIVIAIVIMVVAFAITVGGQIYKVSKNSPADNLRTE
ncbi:ABC transporter permease [Fulvivirga lutimaris]|uniref:ABC transporter permease n=1 Tax=Fulvivirga lutimaris TaxID=1819566 RepID=UPI0012BC97F9|nr:ABC transporter permease [Fulvivirga lutimaris]MTI38892.1 ABC transporter permease [Fulvivirga lutimaris]